MRNKGSTTYERAGRGFVFSHSAVACALWSQVEGMSVLTRGCWASISHSAMPAGMLVPLPHQAAVAGARKSCHKLPNHRRSRVLSLPVH